MIYPVPTGIMLHLKQPREVPRPPATQEDPRSMSMTPLRIALNDHPADFGPTKIARMLLKQGEDGVRPIEFYRGDTPVFVKPRTIMSWAKWSVSEGSQSARFVPFKEVPETLR